MKGKLIFFWRMTPPRPPVEAISRSMFIMDFLYLLPSISFPLSPSLYLPPSITFFWQVKKFSKKVTVASSAFRKVNALHWVLEDGSPNYNPSNSHAKHLQCDFNKRNHTARLYKNTQTEYTTKVYLGRRPRELLPSKYKIYLVQEYRQKDEKCRCQSRGKCF